jgi:hypothetical protein
MQISFARRGWLAVLAITLLLASTLPFTSVSSQSSDILIRKDNHDYVLSAAGLGTFHRSPQRIENARLIELPNSRARIALWDEVQPDGRAVPYNAISLDGQTVARVEQASYDILLRYARFDPVVQRPSLPENLKTTSPSADNVYIVQFVTQPLDEFRKAIEAQGGTIYQFLANHSYLVKMNHQTRAAVESMPFVRWIGNYEPAYRLEEFLLDRLAQGPDTLPATRYNIMLMERGAAKQNLVGGRIASMGGKVDLIIPEGFRFEATLTGQQLLEVARMDEVLFIDRWSAPENDMDIVRVTGGANFIESTLGYTGAGVRAEVMDGNMLDTHTDFQAAPSTMFHGTHTDPDVSHGSCTFGIVFGSGAGNALARGMLPGAQKIFASYISMTNRYTHTQELVTAPYNAVFQSNSWGNALTTSYTTISAEMDDILFKNDFCLLNSQSNNGNQLSRPQAWAKNVVSIGGVNHQNTAVETDDAASGASIGPASDGRIKPDLAHYYDAVRTTAGSGTSSYTTGFNGTSAATPIVAGHFGIFFQMWHAGLFGNTPGASVFESRPHMTTTKAIMINSAHQWSPTGAGINLTRIRQGWGRPDLQNLYNLRSKMFWVNETDLLTNLGSKSYTVRVPAGSTDPLKATMVFADPMGVPASSQHRINDLSLKVTSPTGTVYWGNNGLSGTGQWSTPDGVANTIDTVENVFIQSPAAGNWTVEVIGSEIVQDSHTETPAVDADYALVVSGVSRTSARARFDFDGDGKTDISVFRPSTGNWHILQSSTIALLSQNWGLSTDRLAPADFDGDHKTDIAVFRPSTGAWYALRSSDSSVLSQFWGASGDVPTPADFDGDDKADLAVFRPSTGGWYILQSQSGTMRSLAFGSTGDVPVAGDYDGDGQADVAVYRPSDNGWYIYQSTTNTVRSLLFGTTGDAAVAGDYDGDGVYDVAVFRPSTGAWYMLKSATGTVGGVSWGLSSDRTVPGDYDGDGKVDVAVFRSSENSWYILNSFDGSIRTQAFGLTGDTAVPAAFIP